jgi:hypothetical protein
VTWCPGFLHPWYTALCHYRHHRIRVQPFLVPPKSFQFLNNQIITRPHSNLYDLPDVPWPKSTEISCMGHIREDIHALEEGITTGGKWGSSNLCPHFYALSSAIFRTLFKRKQHKFRTKCLLLYCELGWSLH